jgi:hypothetical protein
MKYNSRSFLNKTTGLSAIETSIDMSSNFMEASVSISDERRQVVLDLSSYSKEKFKANLGKLHKLVSELTLLEAKLKEAESSLDFKNNKF